jgi:hypothetical protein
MPTTIPTTIPIAIPTTIPIAIPTTIPIAIPTTIPKAIPTTIPKAIPTTIPKAIPTTIPKAIPTTIPDTIPKSIPPTQLKTTEYIVQTTILDEEKTSFIFLGFSRATIYDFIIRFFVYFSPIKGKRYPWKMTFPVISSYNENSRILEQVEANCTLQSSESESKVKYLCEIEKRNANLSGIEIIPDFNFIPQNSIEIAGISPLAGMFMKNLLLYDGKYDAILSEANIYLMDNSTLKYAKKLFNITGKIDDPQPKVENKSLVLMINTLSEKENMTEADCKLSNKTENNYYNLNCTGREEFDGNLQASMSFIDNRDILLINFQDSTQSIININETDTKESNKLFFKKKSGGISGGAIAAIVIAFIVILAAVIATIYFTKNKQKNSKDSSENSTFKKLEVIDNNI